MSTQTGEVVGRGPDQMLPCDGWACAVCGPAKRRRLVGHYVGTLGTVADLHLATLTLDPSCGVSPAESRGYAVHLWSLWRRRLGRVAAAAGHGRAVRYVATVEHQAGTGLAHVHAIISLPGISPDAAAAVWADVGGGIVCDVQPIRGARSHGSDDDGPPGSAARSIGYILKYALKEATEHPAARRRYVLASEGTGYHSAAAVARRRAYVEARDGAALPDPGTPRPVAGTDQVEYLIPTVTGRRTVAADLITPERRALWARLRAANRRTSYRYRDERTGEWWRIDQDGPSRTRTPIPPPPRWAPRGSG